MRMLRFAAQRTTIADTQLGIGWELISRDPSALGLENAIAAVEDELTRAHGSSVGDSAVVTDDATIRDIALAAGVAAGAPGLPAGREFAGKLLILRELMHHLGFASIVIRT